MIWATLKVHTKFLALHEVFKFLHDSNSTPSPSNFASEMLALEDAIRSQNRLRCSSAIWNHYVMCCSHDMLAQVGNAASSSSVPAAFNCPLPVGDGPSVPKVGVASSQTEFKISPESEPPEFLNQVWELVMSWFEPHKFYNQHLRIILSMDLKN